MSLKPISSLAEECMKETVVRPIPVLHEEVDFHKHHVHHEHHEHKEECGVGNNWWFYLFWFLVIGIIVWFLLFALKPDFVQKDDYDDNPTGDVDQGKVLLWAVIISLVVIFLVWVFQWGFNSRH